MTKPDQPQGPMRLIVDFGPIVVFFATYKLSGGGLHGTLVATGAFMVAVFIAIVAAAERFGLPIHAIGVGEKADDLRPFDPSAVARAIAGLPPE